MKKILLSLFGFITLGLVNFGNGFNLSPLQIEWLNENAINMGGFTNQGSYVELYDYGNETNGYNRNLCVILRNFTRNSDFAYRITFLSTLSTNSNGNYYGTTSPDTIFCVNGRRRYLALSTSSSSNKFSADNFWVITPEQLLGFISSLSSCESDLFSCQSNLSTATGNLATCQSDLNSCLNSSCDYSEYETQINNLSGDLASCNSLKNSCISDYGVCSSSLSSCYYDLGNCRAGVCDGQYFSNLFINNIQFPSSSNIFVNVPLEFTYKVDLTGNDTDIDIDYNVDADYIEGIITTQNTIPTKDNFNQIVSGLIPLFVPGLVVILFIYFVFRLLKKIF